MNAPETNETPEHKRPVSKATMDKPQEEFIADEPGSAPDKRANKDPHPATAVRRDAE